MYFCFRNCYWIFWVVWQQVKKLHIAKKTRNWRIWVSIPFHFPWCPITSKLLEQLCFWASNSSIPWFILFPVLKLQPSSSSWQINLRQLLSILKLSWNPFGLAFKSLENLTLVRPFFHFIWEAQRREKGMGKRRRQSTDMRQCSHSLAHSPNANKG